MNRSEADAKLIAEMLEALKKTLGSLPTYSRDGTVNPAVEAVIAAIANAEGKSHE